jgi:hypothetical protein
MTTCPPKADDYGTTGEREREELDRMNRMGEGETTGILGFLFVAEGFYWV